MPASIPNKRRDTSSPEYRSAALKYSLILLILGLLGGSCLAYLIHGAETREAESVTTPERARP
ncbi:MAG: hypothetical protein H0U74_13855 [Bradymonadaceae bacterium]|nr:hypothetical protein [Lujinxingiaceae bacterium]